MRRRPFACHGRKALDWITVLPRPWLIGDEPVAELHPDRHAEVGRRICNLISGA
ncbi:MAG: hypothetical protein ACRDS1_04620 [Pseudonocardiaceae bacterium]